MRELPRSDNTMMASSSRQQQQQQTRAIASYFQLDRYLAYTLDKYVVEFVVVALAVGLFVASLLVVVTTTAPLLAAAALVTPPVFVTGFCCGAVFAVAPPQLWMMSCSLTSDTPLPMVST